MTKQLILIPSSRARSLIPKVAQGKSACYYLVNDPQHYDDLRQELKSVILIRNLGGLFHETFQEIKESYGEAVFYLTKKYDSVAWWGGQLASKNNAAAPLPLLHIVYLFCVKKILAKASGEGEVILVLNSRALAKCITQEAFSLGVSVCAYRSIFNEWKYVLRQWLSYGANLFHFLGMAIKSRICARLLPLPAREKVPPSCLRAVIRSWVTKGVFDKDNNFHDRNFGPLPDWLRGQQYEVWTLPMPYNLPESVYKVYKRMKVSGKIFILPEQFLRFSDYIKVLLNHYHLARRRFECITIEGMEVTALFDEAVRQQEFNWEAMFLNLVYPMLQRLRERGYDFDAFYYPLENNLAEKPFILGIREFFPQAKIIGFQHTGVCSELLSYQLLGDGQSTPPLPDRIICSGPRYLSIYREAGFPASRLMLGSNLRFGDVFRPDTDEAVEHRRGFSRTEPKIILLPLPYGQNLAFEILANLWEALGDAAMYSLYIRQHPLLPKKSILQFLEHLRVENYKFADQGILQDWLPRAFALVSGGSSVTVLEAAANGVPVLRLVPANTFSLDPFAGFEYPLSPVSLLGDMRQQLQQIENILESDPLAFKRIGEKVLAAYFTKPDQENLKIFLPCA